MTTQLLSQCRLCPRACGVNRFVSPGACGEGADMRIAKIMLHRWEEPCICGGEDAPGAGAVFFSGCPLRCVFCQNRDISRGGIGKLYTPKALAEAFRQLEAEGAVTLDLVSPTQFLPGILEALDLYRPQIPVVFNTGGYERAETIAAMRGYADVFLTDFKYGSRKTAAEYAAAPDYPEQAAQALREMVVLCGLPRYNAAGILEKGVIIRHLILPGEVADSMRVLELIAKTVSPEDVVLSLMSQYTPLPEFTKENQPKLWRRVTTYEYEKVRDAALKLGFSGYGQDRASARSAYTPDFLEEDNADIN